MPWEKRERKVKVPPRGFPKAQPDVQTPRFLGLSARSIFFLPRQPPNKRKKIHQVSVLTCRQRQGEPGARPRHRRNFWKYKTMHIHNSSIKSASPGRLPSAEAFAAPCPLLFQLCKKSGSQDKRNEIHPFHTHTNISKSQLYLCSDTHQSASQEGFWTGCKFLYYFQKKQNNPPTPAPRLLRCCCK